MGGTRMAVSVGVVNDARAVGDEIRERRVRLGMTVKDLAARAQVDRGRLSAIEDGTANARPSTIGAIEAALDQIEQEMGMNDPGTMSAVGDPGGDLVEFTIEGNFGVRAVVKGPVRDMDALREAVAQIVREMKGPNDPADS